MGDLHLWGRGCSMGKKPVFGLAGLLLAGAVLSGCQKGQHCHNPTCGDKGHMAAGQQGFNQAPARTGGQQQMGTGVAGTNMGQPGAVGMGSGTNQFTNMPGSNTTSTTGVGGSDPFRRSGGAMGRPGDSIGSSTLRPGTFQPIGGNNQGITNIPGNSGIGQPLTPQGTGLPSGSLMPPRDTTSPGIGIPQGNHLHGQPPWTDGQPGVQISPPRDLGGPIDPLPPDTNPIPVQPPQ